MFARMETLEIVRSDEAIVTITLNRPRRKNAINPAMFRELRQAFRDLSADPSVRAVVLTGAGGDFCSGADLAEVDDTGMHVLPWMRQVGECCAALHAVPQPVIAKVVGVAAGAGANLALGCDLIVASDDARFSEIFARRGLSIDFGGSWLLPRLVGLHKAKELALFADILSAAEAHDIGLVNRVVPRGDIDDFVDDWARRLASGPPLALSSTKRLLNASFTMTMEEAVEAEALAQTANFGTQDTVEAIAAFVQKRDPVFRGS
jgi:2-(1,2-epoxy-1,2-dihydrophenyl)acetyl-CoA isomerase